MTYDGAVNAEVIAIGTELLLGFVVNSDTAYLGRVLAGAGIGCYRQTTVGDNPARLAEAVRAALERADIVITCGGLGPTVDDVTLETLARVAGRPLVLNRSILKGIQSRFAKRGIKMPASNRRQAMVPQGAVSLPNGIGTAPGFLLTLPRWGASPLTRYLIALPGPPAELMPMVERHLLPRLRRLTKGTTLLSRTLRLAGVSESEVDAKVRDLLALEGAVTVGIYAHPGQVDLRITAGGKEKEAQRLIASVERKLRARVGGWIFGTDEETLEETIGRLLKKKRKTLAAAESCTGGGIAQRITRVAGSSEYFAGGVVAYSNKLKEKLLSVPSSMLRKHGAVSPQTAAAMAKGVRLAAGADFGLSVTGIAGPSGGTPKKPVGLVYIGLSGPAGTKTSRFSFSGDRGAIQQKAVQAALNLLREGLQR